MTYVGCAKFKGTAKCVAPPYIYVWFIWFVVCILNVELKVTEIITLTGCVNKLFVGHLDIVIVFLLAQFIKSLKHIVEYYLFRAGIQTWHLTNTERGFDASFFLSHKLPWSSYLECQLVTAPSGITFPPKFANTVLTDHIIVFSYWNVWIYRNDTACSSSAMVIFKCLHNWQEPEYVVIIQRVVQLLFHVTGKSIFIFRQAATGHYPDSV